MTTASITVSFADVQNAQQRIQPFIHRTPVFTSQTLDIRAGRKIYFKGELFQKTGSFKFRGVCNAVSQLDETTARRGVITHSSGNHGQALAKAATIRSIPSYIIMPSTATPIKKAAVLEFGGTIFECGPTLAEREAKVLEVQAQTGATLIPPFDHPPIIAGQGTAALELLQDHPDLDAVVAPIGGGGLIAGFCLAAHGLNPSCRVFGAEPSGASTGAKSLAQKQRVKMEETKSIADGLLANQLGQHPWAIIEQHVERVFTVSEQEIIAAMRTIWERMKLLIEPSAAVGVAVILSEEFRALPGLQNVGVVLCGGNVSLDKLPWQ